MTEQDKRRERGREMKGDSEGERDKGRLRQIERVRDAASAVNNGAGIEPYPLKGR